MMPRSIFFGFFAIIIIGILFLSHWYVFHRIADLFSVKRTAIFWIVLCCAVALFPLATLLYRAHSGTAVRIFYTIAAAYIGTFLFLFILVALSHLLSIFVSLPKAATGICIVVIAGILAIASILNYTRITTVPINVPLEKLDHTIKIVQISDVHIGNTRTSAYLERVVTQVNKESPDIVVITGDLVDGTTTLEHGSLDSINKINAPVYYIYGNHEYYEGIDTVNALLKTTKATILRDSMITTQGITIIGLDYNDSLHHGREILPAMKFQKPVILLNHVPLDFATAQQQGVGLQLSGHTHNGQIFPLNFIVKLIYEYPVGLHQREKSWIYVSPGTGTWGPPFRSGSNNEITSITLVPA
jgi:hypothetical protein